MFNSKDKKLPKLIFELRKDHNLFVDCTWPVTTTEAEAKEVIEAVASIVFLVVSGKVFPAIQHAIANHKNEDPRNQIISKAVLFHVQHALEQHGLMFNRVENEDNDEPVVDPTEAFSVRGGDS